MSPVLSFRSFKARVVRSQSNLDPCPPRHFCVLVSGLTPPPSLLLTSTSGGCPYSPTTPHVWKICLGVIVWKPTGNRSHGKFPYPACTHLHQSPAPPCRPSLSKTVSDGRGGWLMGYEDVPVQALCWEVYGTGCQGCSPTIRMECGTACLKHCLIVKVCGERT